jgi:hypothetical protein
MGVHDVRAFPPEQPIETQDQSRVIADAALKLEHRNVGRDLRLEGAAGGRAADGAADSASIDPVYELDDAVLHAPGLQ